MLQRKAVGWDGATDLKRLTNALVPFYASLHCHFMIQGTIQIGATLPGVPIDLPDLRWPMTLETNPAVNRRV